MDLAVASAGILGAALVATAVGWRLQRGLKSRYRHLLQAIELVQRQATELRTEVDRLRLRVEAIGEQVAGIGDRLTRRVEPELGRLTRHLAIEDTAAALRRAEAQGHLPAEAARRVERYLVELDEEVAAGDRAF
jgi:hypothetical protein